MDENLDVTQFEHLFIMGDLNYRIDLPYVQAIKYITNQNYNKLLEFDQLKKEINNSNILYGFNEQNINFNPTFKLDVGSDNYERKVIFYLI
jgi:hypothetical protein